MEAFAGIDICNGQSSRKNCLSGQRPSSHLTWAVLNYTSHANFAVQTIPSLHWQCSAVARSATEPSSYHDPRERKSRNYFSYSQTYKSALGYEISPSHGRPFRNRGFQPCNAASVAQDLSFTSHCDYLNDPPTTKNGVAIDKDSMYQITACFPRRHQSPS